MTEFAPSATQEDYKKDHPNLVDNVSKAHIMALESDKVRTEAATARSIGKLILSEMQKYDGGPDKFGREAGERFLQRTKDVEETLYPVNMMKVSEDVEGPALRAAGLNGPGARERQLDRFYKARTVLDNNSGDAGKALDQIEAWSNHLDKQADEREDAVGQTYDMYNNQNH